MRERLYEVESLNERPAAHGADPTAELVNEVRALREAVERLEERLDELVKVAKAARWWYGGLGGIIMWLPAAAALLGVAILYYIILGGPF